MKRILLLSILFVLPVFVSAQEAVQTQLNQLAKQADDAILDGKREEARQLYRQMTDSCRKSGDEYLLQEFHALYSLSGLEGDVPGKKLLLQEMKARLSSASTLPHPALLEGYVTMVQAEIDKYEGRSRDVYNALVEVYKKILNAETDPDNGKLVKLSVLMMIADNLAENGFYDQSLEMYELAETIMEQPATRMETVYLGTIKAGQALACRELGRLDDAEALFKQAHTILERVGAQRSRQYAYLLINDAGLQMSRGHYKESIKTLDLALDLIPEPSNDRVETLLLYSSVLINQGKFSQAEEVMKEVDEHASHLTMPPYWWVTYYQIQAGLHMTAGRIKNAIEVTGEAIALMNKEGIINPKIISGLYNQMSANYSLLGDEERAKAYQELSEEILNEFYGETYMDSLKKEDKDVIEGPYDRVSRLISLINEDADAGRHAAALEKVDEALKIYKENGIGGSSFLSIYALKLYMLQNEGNTKNLKKAIDGYMEELRKDVRLNLSFMTEEEREVYYANIMPSISYASLTSKDPSLAEQAYNAVLLRKNFLLGAGISLEKLISDSGDSDLQNVLQEMKALRSGPAQDPKLPESERYAASSRADELETILVRKSHDYGDFLALSDIRWEDVRDALGPHDVAVEFIQSGVPKLPVYCALVLRSGWKRPKNIVLVGDEDQLMATLADPEYNELVYGEPNLYNVFWEPLEEYLKNGDKVYFSMDGFLNAFAFEHFVTDDGDRMMDRFELHRVSSTREIIGWKQREADSSAALFGGFDYNLSGEEVSYYASATRNDSNVEEWGYLPGTLAEVEAAESILRDKMDVTLYTGEDGLESRFKALSGKATDLIHVATHGYYHEGNDDPMESSGLVFSGANALLEEGPAESGEDGLLKASEIALMDLRSTDLVVLSACQSGVGSISSDGVYGLQRAFKKAGVRSILMSLWKVDDQVTAEMMRLFYTGLSSGMSSWKAFQEARETLRKTYKDPLLWAPFVLLES